MAPMVLKGSPSPEGGFMRTKIATGFLLSFGGAYLYQQRPTYTPPAPPEPVFETAEVTAVEEAASQMLPMAVAQKPMTLEAQAEALENELANLNHEIEQGRYLDRINDPGTPDYIKKELRARLRLMVKKTLALTQLNLQRIDQAKSI